MKKFILFFLVFGIIYSCSEVDIPPKTNLVGDKQNVEEVTKSFILDFDPQYKEGMKFTYVITNLKNNISEEISSEVLSVVGQKIKVRFTDSKGSREQEANISDFSSDIPMTGIQKIGTETVKVPAGEFKDTTVVSYYPSSPDGKVRSKSTIWLVKGIGLVKKQDLLQNTDIIVTELKDFKSN